MLAEFFFLTKMKRNATNDNDDQFVSARKKLKFGVDTILGNVNNHSDNEQSNSSNHVSISSVGSNNSHPPQVLWRPNLRPYIGKIRLFLVVLSAR